MNLKFGVAPGAIEEKQADNCATPPASLSSRQRIFANVPAGQLGDTRHPRDCTKPRLLRLTPRRQQSGLTFSRKRNEPQTRASELEPIFPDTMFSSSVVERRQVGPAQAELGTVKA